jgi:hypothetical protein
VRVERVLEVVVCPSPGSASTRRATRIARPMIDPATAAPRRPMRTGQGIAGVARAAPPGLARQTRTRRAMLLTALMPRSWNADGRSRTWSYLRTICNPHSADFFVHSPPAYRLAGPESVICFTLGRNHSATTRPHTAEVGFAPGAACGAGRRPGWPPGWPRRQHDAAPDAESSPKISDFIRKYRLHLQPGPRWGSQAGAA